MTAVAGRLSVSPLATAPRGLDTLPLVLHLLGVYLAVPIVLPGGIEFPMAATLVTVPLLLALNAHSVRLAHLGWLAGLVGVAAVTLALAPQPGAFLVPRLRGLVLWAYSLVCAYVLVLELQRWPREKLARLMLGATLAVLAGCVLEIVGLLRPLSDGFRNFVFPAGAVSSHARDIEIAGFERPSLFTSEPSDVAKFLLLSSFGYVALSASRWRHITGLVVCLVAAALTRSPIVVLLLPLQVLLLAFGRPLVTEPRLVSRPMKAIVLLLVGVLATVLVATLLAGRIAQALEGRDSSSTIRIVTPVFIAWETLNDSPWWGAGISGTESIEDSIVLGFELAGIASLADPEAMNSDAALANMVNNAFWLHWINLGLLGGSISIVLLAAFMGSLGMRRKWLAFAALFVFAQTMGGAHAPYFWTFAAAIIGLVWHLDSTGLLELRGSGPVEDAVDLQEPTRPGI
jgi:hypothetical protein